MTIQILRGVLIGTNWHHAGSVVDVHDDVAKRHIKAGSAAAAVRLGPVECAELAGPAVAETADAAPRGQARRRGSLES